MYTEASVLSHFNPSLEIEPREYYPAVKGKNIHYHFWLDLEHGYCETAGIRIARILVARNPSLWKPTLPANNHWSNWESGHL